MKMKYRIALAAAGAALTMPCLAQDRSIDTKREVVILRHIDHRPATPAAAKKALERIDTAALTACGATPFSLREMKAATRRSPCWREAMAGAIAQIGTPLLSETYRRRYGG